MYTEKEWLMKQEQINDELRQRAEERARRLSNERQRHIHVPALAPRKALQRTLASAARLLVVGG